MDTQYFYGKRGVATTFGFVLRTPSGTDSDTFFAGTAPEAGDCYVFLDGVYDSVADAAPVEVPETTGAGAVSLYTIEVSADQMSANTIDIIINDPGVTFRDAHLKIYTEINLGNVDIDASQGSNLSALKLTGQGTGHGLEAIGGATGQDINGVLGEHVLRKGVCRAASSGTTFYLDASASASNDYYNGAIVMVVGGTGAGQARVITDYVASTQACTINKALVTATDSASQYVIIPGDDPWKISPGAELSAIPTFASNYADLLQFLFQRFAYKRTQTATAFSMKKVDDSTQLGSATLSDDATTQTHGRIS